MIENKTMVWMILGVSFALAYIDNFLKINLLVGGWHIVLYLLLLLPLVFLLIKKEVTNPYTKWFIPALAIMIVDMFYYSNEMVQSFVPIFFYIGAGTLYLTSMHQVQAPYQTLLPSIGRPRGTLGYMRGFFRTLFSKDIDKKLLGRVGIALLITVPFLVVFVVLLASSDQKFGSFIMDLFFILSPNIHIESFITFLLAVVVYVMLFVITLSQQKDRTNIQEHNAFDGLIVGIFLGMINLLFAMFIMINIPFLFGEMQLPEGTNIAEFARGGFFQLMLVLGLVVLIFLFIMRRYKKERSIQIALIALLVQTSLMGWVSLKKMYLYQSIKGATVLRYYVEWFDYFLLVVLALGVVFLLRGWLFQRFLNILVIFGLASFLVVISLNIDDMVARYNIHKFQGTDALDTQALADLSIDAYPAIKEGGIAIDAPIYIRDCSHFSGYHFGFCQKVKKYVDVPQISYHDSFTGVQK